MPEATWKNYRFPTRSALTLGDPDFMDICVELFARGTEVPQVQVILRVNPSLSRLEGDRDDLMVPTLSCLSVGLKKIVEDLDKALEDPTSNEWV